MAMGKYVCRGAVARNEAVGVGALCRKIAACEEEGVGGAARESGRPWPSAAEKEGTGGEQGGQPQLPAGKASSVVLCLFDLRGMPACRFVRAESADPRKILSCLSVEGKSRAGRKLGTRWYGADLLPLRRSVLKKHCMFFPHDLLHAYKKYVVEVSLLPRSCACCWHMYPPNARQACAWEGGKLRVAPPPACRSPHRRYNWLSCRRWLLTCKRAEAPWLWPCDTWRLRSAWSPTYWMLVLCRTMVGFGLGGASVIFSLCSEFLPSSSRGFWLVFIEFFWTVGSIAEALMAWAIMPNMSWRLLILFSSAPFAVLLACYPLLPESPRFLLVKGDVEGAMGVLKRVARLNGTALPPGVLSQSSSTPCAANKRGPSGARPTAAWRARAAGGAVKRKLRKLLGSSLRRSTLLLWGVFFACAFTYYGQVLLTTELTVAGSSGSGHCSSASGNGTATGTPGRKLTASAADEDLWERLSTAWHSSHSLRSSPSTHGKGSSFPRELRHTPGMHELGVHGRDAAQAQAWAQARAQVDTGLGKYGSIRRGRLRSLHDMRAVAGGAVHGLWDFVRGSAMRTPTTPNWGPRSHSSGRMQVLSDSDPGAVAEEPQLSPRLSSELPRRIPSRSLLEDAAATNAATAAVAEASATASSSECTPEGRPRIAAASYRNVLITSCAELPGLVSALLIVDRFGRKGALGSLLLAAGVLLAPLLAPQAALLTTALMFGARACIMGAFSVLWAYAPELYSTDVRATGVGVANAFSRLGGFLCPYVAVDLVASCRRALAVGLFAVVPILAAAASAFFPVETKGRALVDEVPPVKPSTDAGLPVANER